MGLFKKVKKQVKKAKEDVGIGKAEKYGRKASRGIEDAGFKKTYQKAGKEWRSLMKKGRDTWQAAGESVTGKDQRDIAEMQSKAAQKQKEEIKLQQAKEQAALKEAEDTRKKKLRAAQTGRRSLLGG